MAPVPCLGALLSAESPLDSGNRATITAHGKAADMSRQSDNKLNGVNRSRVKKSLSGTKCSLYRLLRRFADCSPSRVASHKETSQRNGRQQGQARERPAPRGHRMKTCHILMVTSRDEVAAPGAEDRMSTAPDNSLQQPLQVSDCPASTIMLTNKQPEPRLSFCSLQENLHGAAVNASVDSI